MEGQKLKLAREYVSKFPDHKKRTIAKVLARDYPDVFKNMEEARTNVRIVTGSYGNAMRKDVKNKSMYDERAKSLLSIFDDFEFGDLNDFDAYEIPKNIKKIGHMGDIHIPYHNKEAVILALEFFLKKEVDCIIINGDLIDCYSLSRFQKDPTKRRFKGELDLTKDFLKRVREAFPDVLIVYKEGNHEERFEAILKIKAPEFFDVAEFKLDVLLRLRELDIQYVGNKKIIHAGKLNVLHGHEFGRQLWSPVNPARGAYMRAKENVVIGHHHQTSEHSEPSLNKKEIAAWSLGCLSDMNPEYMPINRWNLGFGVQTMIDDRGNFRFDNKKILVEKIGNNKYNYSIV